MDHNLIHEDPPLGEARRPKYSWIIIPSTGVFFMCIPNT